MTYAAERYASPKVPTITRPRELFMRWLVDNFRIRAGKAGFIVEVQTKTNSKFRSNQQNVFGFWPCNFNDISQPRFLVKWALGVSVWRTWSLGLEVIQFPNEMSSSPNFYIHWTWTNFETQDKFTAIFIPDICESEMRSPNWGLLIRKHKALQTQNSKSSEERGSVLDSNQLLLRINY